MVSIPSRGFWFFEDVYANKHQSPHNSSLVSIPSRGFWFFEVTYAAYKAENGLCSVFQSPRGDFGFLKRDRNRCVHTTSNYSCFNPLAGILVF